MKAWWNGLSASERRTLSIGGITGALMLAYFMIWQPIQQTTAELERELREQQALLGWLQPAVAEIRARGGAPGTAPGSTGQGGQGGQDGQGNGQALFALADQSARQAGLGQVLKQVEPSADGGARVTFERVGFDELLRWLAQLQDRNGITATQVSLRRGALEGRVDAQIQLEMNQ